jgi:hypothetical protein
VLALTAIRAVHFAAAIQIVGALLFVCMMGRLPALAADGQRRGLLRASAVLAVIAFASALAWLLGQAADMTGHTLRQAWNDGAVGLLLFKTHAGVVWVSASRQRLSSAFGRWSADAACRAKRRCLLPFCSP